MNIQKSVGHPPPLSLREQVKAKVEQYQYDPRVYHAGDRLELSKQSQYMNAKNQPTLTKRIKQTLSGVANFALTQHYMDLRSQPTHRPVVQALSKFMLQSKLGFHETRRFAVAQAHSLNPNKTASDVVAIAYESMLGVALDQGFHDPQFFEGQRDKVLHFLASGSLSARLYDEGLPEIVRGGVASKVSYSLGVLKEVFGPPFDRHDIEANSAGINSAQQDIKILEVTQTPGYDPNAPGLLGQAFQDR